LSNFRAPLDAKYFIHSRDPVSDASAKYSSQFEFWEASMYGIARMTRFISSMSIPRLMKLYASYAPIFMHRGCAPLPEACFVVVCFYVLNK
jgi:hypothetical protein